MVSILHHMCGRFTLHHSTEDVAERFAVEQTLLELRPRFNIAPSQPVAAVIQRDSRVMQELKWGLVPSWARDPAIGNRLINARAETLADKPAFRGAFARGRCLIPASGYFEWHRAGQVRTPMLVRRAGGEPFAMAGLYERWQTPEEGILRSCSIITTEPNEVAATVHHRMPAILTREDVEIWLDADVTDLQALARVLRPYPLADLIVHPVSDRVNHAGNDDASLVDVVEPATPTQDPQLGLGL
ncbi:MAG: SOS response-associated peptidase [bacterium]|nr:SOS response-associated peptidase [bacterium]